eukprot:gene10077-12354_t
MINSPSTPPITSSPVFESKNTTPNFSITNPTHSPILAPTVPKTLQLSSIPLPQHTLTSPLLPQQQQTQHPQQPIYNKNPSSPQTQNNNNNFNIKKENVEKKKVKIEIIDNELENPFPRLSIQNHVISPPPKIKVEGAEGRDIFIICQINPKDAFSIVNFSNTKEDPPGIFTFPDLKVERRKSKGSYKNFTLSFMVQESTQDYQTQTLCHASSGSLSFFNHTNDLPNPEIVRLIPNSAFISRQPTIIDCYSNYFKFGAKYELNIDYFYQNKIVTSVPQKDITKEQCFHITYPPPKITQAGSYQIFARYDPKTKKTNSIKLPEQGGQTFYYLNDNDVNPGTFDIKQNVNDQNNNEIGKGGNVNIGMGGNNNNNNINAVNNIQGLLDYI